MDLSDFKKKNTCFSIEGSVEVHCNWSKEWMRGFNNLLIIKGYFYGYKHTDPHRNIQCPYFFVKIRSIAATKFVLEVIIH